MCSRKQWISPSGEVSLPHASGRISEANTTHFRRTALPTSHASLQTAMFWPRVQCVYWYVFSSRHVSEAICMNRYRTIGMRVPTFHYSYHEPASLDTSRSYNKNTVHSGSMCVGHRCGHGGTGARQIAQPTAPALVCWGTARPAAGALAAGGHCWLPWTASSSSVSSSGGPWALRAHQSRPQWCCTHREQWFSVSVR